MNGFFPEDVSQVLPWVENFERGARTYVGRFGITDAMLLQIDSIRADMAEAVRSVGAIEAAMAAAVREIALAKAELLEATQRHFEADQAFKSAVDERARVVQEAASQAVHLAAQLERTEGSVAPTFNEVTGSLGSGLSQSAKVPIAGVSHAGLWAPARLTVRAQAERINTLQWEANGNTPNTLYLVEAAVGQVYRGVASEPDRLAYKLVARVPGTTVYSHQLRRATVGVRVMYRVRASRDNLAGPYSNEVIVACQ